MVCFSFLFDCLFVCCFGFWFFYWLVYWFLFSILLPLRMKKWMVKLFFFSLTKYVRFLLSGQALLSSFFGFPWCVHLPAATTQPLQEVMAPCQYVYVLSQQHCTMFSKFIDSSRSMDTIEPSTVMPRLVCALTALAGGILAVRLLSGISKHLVWALTSPCCCSLVAFGTANS